MNKHIKIELDSLAKLLSSKRIKFSPFIKNYSKDEKKYIENKCKFFNIESFKQSIKR